MSDSSDKTQHEAIEGKLMAKQKEQMKDMIPGGLIRMMPTRMVTGNGYLKYEKRIRNLSIREDDVWITTFPKSGTTWAQEMVWCLLNDLDFQTARRLDQFYRSPFLEFSAIQDLNMVKESEIPNSDLRSEKMTIDYVDTLKSPRCIKTHLHYSLLPEQIKSVKPKLIYVLRDPRDVVVSFFHHYRLVRDFTGSFEDFVEYFINDIVMFSPYFEHIHGYWQRRSEGNILILKFAEMKRNLPGVIRRTAEFLNKTLNDHEVSQLADHLSFESMKRNESVNKQEYGIIEGQGGFLRKGQVGDWKNFMNEQISEKFEKWVQCNLKRFGEEFSFE